MSSGFWALNKVRALMPSKFIYNEKLSLLNFGRCASEGEFSRWGMPFGVQEGRGSL
ncbi:hypothetical protein bcgnr5371_60280 [Bacillus cereus]